MLNMYTYKEIKLVTRNSSWWKQVKYRRESAFALNNCRKQGWRLIKKVGAEYNSKKADTRSFSKYFLRKRLK